jgi:hypothetical protein
VINKGKERAAIEPEAYYRAAASGLTAAGVIFLAGSIADFLILWFMGRQAVPEWEFAAVASTVEGMPRIVLGIAMIYAGMYVRRTRSPWIFRILGSVLLLTALTSVGLAGLLVTDYFALRANVRPEAITAFRTTTAKTLFLCGLYFFMTVPVAMASLRRPRQPRTASAGTGA